MDRTIVIGTRGSQLALWQARHAKEQLENIGLECEIKEISTQGDRRKEASFSTLKGVGFFTKEIQLALLNEEIDVAVHSHKDLATESPDGLTIGAVSYREAPHDVLLIHPDSVDTTQSLPFKKEAKVGTTSPRRRSQIKAFRPDAQLKDLRGNVHTRVQKLRNEQYDAIVMAQAGINRGEVALEGLKVEQLSPHLFVPAAAQGVLAYEIRSDEKELYQLLQQINQKEVQQTTQVERTILAHLEGGCQLPYGAYCQKEKGDYHLWVSKADEWQQMPKRLYLKGTEAEVLTQRILKKLDDHSPRSVFITRDLDQNSFFYRCLTAYGYDVKGESLIEFSPIEFEDIPTVDWVFFTSPNAVRFFLKQVKELTKGSKLGVTGMGTARALRQQGFEPDFVGEGKNTKEIGRIFGKRADGQKVLFPMNEDSLRSIQKGAGQRIQSIDLPVYKSKVKEDISIPDTEIVVFTSPKNVRSYFMQATFNGQQQVVAIGPKTGSALEKVGVSDYHLPYTPGMVQLVDIIFGLPEIQ